MLQRSNRKDGYNIMMSDEIAMLTLSSAILFAVLMFAILMRKA